MTEEKNVGDERFASDDEMRETENHKGLTSEKQEEHQNSEFNRTDETPKLEQNESNCQQKEIPSKSDIGEADRMVEKIRRQYFEEMKSQQEVADNLGFKTTKPIRRVFEEQGWEARWGTTQKGIEKPSDFQERRTRGRLDPDEIKRLYFDEGLTHKQIAERASFSSVNPVRRIFKEQGWKSRIQRGGVSPQHFKSEEERRLARIEHKKKTAQRIRELREKMWGTECKLCSVSKERRLLHIHRKDGKQHPEEVLHRLKVLKSLEPNDYVPLCGTCHSGTHWLMNNQGMTWKDIESYSEKFNKSLQTPKEPLALPDARVKSSERYLGLIRQKDISPKELRREIFGENCRFCGTHSDDMRIFVHRKDLRPHRKRLLESKKYLRTLNPDEWATLCPICHRRTHWAGETLGLDWDDLESAFKQRST